MSKIKLVIDTREKQLINTLKQQTEYEIEQLNLGDIIFKKEEEIILIIERKTISDLRASICDGRYREQKMRLMGNFKTNRIVYLVEGNEFGRLELGEKIKGIPTSNLLCSLINTQLRDNIKVYKTNNIFESVNFILKLKDKLEKDLDIYFQEKEKEITANDYACVIKKCKKSNMTSKVWFISQLALIPQVSETIAIEIVEKYKNVIQLISSYETLENEDDKKKLLSPVTYPIKNNKTRKIGNKISERIYNFFYDK